MSVLYEKVPATTKRKAAARMIAQRRLEVMGLAAIAGIVPGWHLAMTAYPDVGEVTTTAIFAGLGAALVALSVRFRARPPSTMLEEIAESLPPKGERLMLSRPGIVALALFAGLAVYVVGRNIVSADLEQAPSSATTSDTLAD